MSRRSSGDHLGTQRGERYAASCTRPCPHCSRTPRVQQPWGGEAPSAQHPVPSTQCPAPSAAEPHSHSLRLRAARISQRRAAKPRGGPRVGAVHGGLAVAMEARPAWSRQAAAQDGSKEREDETNQESRGVRASSGPGAGDPPGEADRLQQRRWAADPTRKAAAQRDPAR